MLLPLETGKPFQRSVRLHARNAAGRKSTHPWQQPPDLGRSAHTMSGNGECRRSEKMCRPHALNNVHVSHKQAHFLSGCRAIGCISETMWIPCDGRFRLCFDVITFGLMRITERAAHNRTLEFNSVYVFSFISCGLYGLYMSHRGIRGGFFNQYAFSCVDVQRPPTDL